MFWNKKPEAPKSNPRSTLVIEMRDRTVLSWDVTPWQLGQCPWKDFLSWYHGRQQSSHYVMRHRDGEQGFQRHDIARYAIKNYGK